MNRRGTSLQAVFRETSKDKLCIIGWMLLNSSGHSSRLWPVMALGFCIGFEDGIQDAKIVGSGKSVRTPALIYEGYKDWKTGYCPLVSRAMRMRLSHITGTPP